MPPPVVDLALLEGFGFGDDPAALLEAVLPRVERLSLAGDDEVLAWTDEASGARLVLGAHGADVQWLWPTLWGPTSTLLGGLQVLADGVVGASVVDAAGARLAHVVLRLEQGRALSAEILSRTWPAAVVATGRVRAFADADSFAADPISIVGDPASYAAQAPAHYAERGWAWPPRLSEESFAPIRDASGRAELTGTVVAAEDRHNDLTGRDFRVNRVRTLGFDLDLCLPAEHEPTPVGSVVAGVVNVSGRLGVQPGDPRQRWVQRTG